MRYSILYKTAWKETLPMNSWEIVFGQHYNASKRPTFKCDFSTQLIISLLLAKQMWSQAENCTTWNNCYVVLSYSCQTAVPWLKEYIDMKCKRLFRGSNLYSMYVCFRGH